MKLPISVGRETMGGQPGFLGKPFPVETLLGDAGDRNSLGKFSGGFRTVTRARAIGVLDTANQALPEPVGACFFSTTQ